MGFINLLKNGYRGKLGETVGQKWKDQLTVRTYQGTNNSKSPAQLDQRAHYKTLIQEAAGHYPLFCTTEKYQVKGMNKFNLFTQFWDKSEGGLNANYPKNPYFKKQTIQNVYLISQWETNAIYIGFPYEGANEVKGIQDIKYTFIFNPNQKDAQGNNSEFFLDQISVKRANFRNKNSGAQWNCLTLVIPGKNIYLPKGIRQLIPVINGEKKYLEVTSSTTSIASRSNNIVVTLL